MPKAGPCYPGHVPIRTMDLMKKGKRWLRMKRETVSGYWVFCWVARFNDGVVITALVAPKEHSLDL